MKKRITALILVVVMSALALFGCGEYDYADADLNEFSSVNVAALKNALKNIHGQACFLAIDTIHQQNGQRI